jgi:hypothetical protein
MTRRVWVAECLCPDRHCILAAFNLADNEVEAETLKTVLRQQMDAALQSGAFNPWCAICGATQTTWKYEVVRTPYATLAEAQPHLTKVATENLITNMLFGDLHKGGPN